jgi:predicted NAD/FAD-dependent oxidoreductase
VRGGRIAVVGAGIAGLTAARRLAREALDVVVFEKARGVGGRTSTRRQGTLAFDHGAQYLTCRGEDLGRQLHAWCRRGVAVAWREPIVVIGAGEIAEPVDEATRYVGVPGMSALARDLATGLRVECGRRIERITGRPGSWSLVTQQGPTLDGFDAVVVATPAPQAAPLLAPAPRLATLARDVEMRPCHAVMVTFSEPLGVGFGAAFVARPPLAWVARNASKPGRPGGECWVLHATPEWSTRHLEDPAHDVARLLLAALGEVLGVALPPTSSQAAHRWRFARAAKPLGQPSLWDAEAGLGACGDWTHGSRVEDAFTSGDLLARAMLGQRVRAGSHAGAAEGTAR